MSTPKFSGRTVSLWCVLHICTVCLPLFALCIGATLLDVLLPICSNLVVNFAPSLLLDRIIKPNLNLAKDCQDAAEQGAKRQGLSEEEAQEIGQRTKFRNEAGQEIVGHLCITIISIFGLLASALVLNVAYQLTAPAQPPLMNVIKTAGTTTNLAATAHQTSPNSGKPSKQRRTAGVVVVGVSLLFSIVCIFHMAVRTNHFVGESHE